MKLCLVVIINLTNRRHMCHCGYNRNVIDYYIVSKSSIIMSKYQKGINKASRKRVENMYIINNIKRQAILMQAETINSCILLMDLMF